jgi:type IV pilus assembly protein PilC
MPEYKYSAKNPVGRQISGVITAQNENDALGELRRQNLVVLKLESSGPKRPSFALASLLKPTVKASKARVKLNELIVFTRQLATMLSAGIPLLECLDILREQTEDPGFKAVIGEMSDDVRSGHDFSETLKKFPRVFSNIFVNMIRAGEASGQLDEILVRLAEYQEASAKLRSKIRAAMTYPVVSLTLILAISVCLLLFIVPKFENIFKTIGGELPRPTQILMAISLFLREKVAYWVGGVIAITIIIVMYSRTEMGRRHLDRLKLAIPIFGPLFQKVALSRFARTFATLIESGVPILGALEIVAATSGNKIVEDAVLNASESVRGGDTLANPLSKSKVFPPMVTRMIAIGEKSGALEALLNKISEFYDQQVSATVEALTSLIEPLMIGVMGILVGGMVISLFLPIIELTKKLRPG